MISSIPTTGASRPWSAALFIVGTPIGNLEDITLRALRVLGEVAAIACEDTRQTLKILNRYGIRKPLISYYQPRQGQRVPEIIRLLKEGRDVTLVSDAGTPGISDPGFPLIRAALKDGIAVLPIPGPSAVTAALAAWGLPTHPFYCIAVRIISGRYTSWNQASPPSSPTITNSTNTKKRLDIDQIRSVFRNPAKRGCCAQV